MAERGSRASHSLATASSRRARSGDSPSAKARCQAESGERSANTNRGCAWPASGREESDISTVGLGGRTVASASSASSVAKTGQCGSHSQAAAAKTATSAKAATGSTTRGFLGMALLTASGNGHTLSQSAAAAWRVAVV